VVVAGGGIVGAACALACAQAGLRVAWSSALFMGSGATAAGMGHIVVMDDSEAQFALTRRSQQLWQALSPALPAGAEYETPGTLWVAADEEELAEAARKAELACRARRPEPPALQPELAESGTQPAPGPGRRSAGHEDAVVYPPVVALHLARQAQALGATLIVGRAVTRLANGEAVLDDGTRLRAPGL
jgi:glycine/D-amino acid oxidase-like deaminating enzyme